MTIHTRVAVIGGGRRNSRDCRHGQTASCYLRKLGRLLLAPGRPGPVAGTYENRCHHWAIDGTPLDFGHELLPDDLQRMEANIEIACDRLPALLEAGVKRIINGPMIFSPDLGPLLGPPICVITSAPAV